MRVPLPQRTRDRFDDTNSLLRAALGALSFAARFDALLAKHAPLDAEHAGDESAEDPFLFAILGAVALRARVGAEIERMTTVTPKPSDVEAGAARDRRGLLR